MERLKRKIDIFLSNWKKDKDHLPLIVKGARQDGKTNAIEYFAQNNYENFISINFILQPQYKSIFDNGYEVDAIIKNISLINPNYEFIPQKTLIFFDEIQDCIKVATSLKAFKIDGRFDVICSGSFMGINYKEIESNSVGYKQDYENLRENKNFNTYKGAIYENIVGDMLVKAGYDLYFYKNKKGTLEMDFFIRDKDSLIPDEVKASNNSSISLNKLIDDKKYQEIKWGIKLGLCNIGFNGKFYTFPYFLTFLLKRFLKEKMSNDILTKINKDK